MSIQRDKVYRQTYRVADDSLNRYELYVGEGEMPDFDASDQPVATASSLPISWSPTPPGAEVTKVLYCVLRKRNQYNLLSHNQHPTLIEIDENGDEVLGPLTAPEVRDVVDGESGEIVVFGRYSRDVDQNEADTWDVYAEKGVDPDPDVHTPKDTQTMGKPGVDYFLRSSITGLDTGETYHVRIVVRRADESGDGEIGESTVFQHTTAIAIDVDPDETDVSGGDEQEIDT